LTQRNFVADFFSREAHFLTKNGHFASLSPFRRLTDNVRCSC